MKIKHHQRDFFGIFTFFQLQCDDRFDPLEHNGQFHFDRCELLRPLGELPKGWKCPQAIFNFERSTLTLIKNWTDNWFNYKPDEYYEFTLDDLCISSAKTKIVET